MNDERYWNINQLNKWFAIASIIFMVSMIWMFIDDNDDDFKVYQRKFRHLEIKNEALIEIAKLAVHQKTGARGLRSIMEYLLIDLMYESPDQKDLEKIVISADVVQKNSKPILIFSNKQNNQKILATKT